MACATVHEGLAAATEYLSKELYTLAKFDSVFLNVVPDGGPFTPHTGTTHTVFRILAQEPTNDEVGGDEVNITFDSGQPGACSYNFESVSAGYNKEDYSPLRLQFKGPLFCKDDQYFNHVPDQFISEYLSNMAGYVTRRMDQAFLYNYARKVPIYVAGANFDSPTAASQTLTAPAATSELTQQMLDELNQQLIYNRAERPDSNGIITTGNDGPLWSLLIGNAASQLIAVNNAEFREDLRWADASQFLRRLGAGRVIKNFRHVPHRLPARYTHDGAKYVRVNTFSSSLGVKGSGTNVSDTWKDPATAPYEAAFILSPYVFSRETINPNAGGSGLSFPTTDYLGHWWWKTGPEAIANAAGDACFDPAHKMGRHFGEYMWAPRPGALPQSGAIIFYKRCPQTFDEVTCS